MVDGLHHVPPHAEAHPVLDRIVEALRKQRPVPEATWEQRRFAMKAAQAKLRMPEGVDLESVTVAGRKAAWIRHADAAVDPAAGCVLYLHGGGYALGSVVTHQELMARLSGAAGLPVLGIDYRLAPEHPFPAAVEDAHAAVRWLYAQGITPERLVLAGDSAGGGLALATAIRLRNSGDPLPAGLALLSPWTDLTASGASLTERGPLDPMVSLEGLQTMAMAYAGGRRGEPLASPLFADLSGLPAVYTQVGDSEVLLDDATRLHRHLESSGVPSRLEVWERMLHVFQAFPQLPEAAQAVTQLGAWIRLRVGEA